MARFSANAPRIVADAIPSPADMRVHTSQSLFVRSIDGTIVRPNPKRPQRARRGSWRRRMEQNRCAVRRQHLVMVSSLHPRRLATSAEHSMLCRSSGSSFPISPRGIAHPKPLLLSQSRGIMVHSSHPTILPISPHPMPAPTHCCRRHRSTLLSLKTSFDCARCSGLFNPILLVKNRTIWPMRFTRS